MHQSDERRWNVMPDKKLAFYIRLSMEDGDLKTTKDKHESNSISNQRALLIDYYTVHAQLQEYSIVEFCDDGYSGTNFNRPQFIEMMEAIRHREIQAIIVKDLSRFGREYLEVGGYLELIFPLFDIRFISVNDNFDSYNYQGTTGGLDLALHNLINGLYSIDLSVKVRSAVKIRNKSGMYLGAQAFYGYLLDPYDKHKLIVDDDVKDIVVSIFDMCINGMSARQIAQHLNNLEIASPAEHKRQHGMFYNGRVLEETPIWISSTIRKILKDERYTGTMVSGTRESVGIRSKKFRLLPESEWIKKECTHEAIISQDTYQRACTALASRIRCINQNTAGFRSHNLFICGYCGRKLQKSNGKKVYLYCLKSKTQDNAECKCLHEDMEQLQSKTLLIVQTLAKTILDKSKNIKKYNISASVTLQKENAAIENRCKQITNNKRILYEDYHAGRMTKEHFIKIQADNMFELEQLRNHINRNITELEEWKAKEATLSGAKKDADEIQVLKAYQPEVISRLVKTIRVFADGRIEISLKNTDILEALETSFISIVCGSEQRDIR